MTTQLNIAPSILSHLTHLEGAETPKDLDERLPLFGIFRTCGDYRGARPTGAESLANDKVDLR